MNYLTITHCDQVNGTGNRVVLWTAGCSHHCKECQNAYSWDATAGVTFDAKAKAELFSDLSTDWCAGITYSGGDPLFADNRATVMSLAKEIHEKFPTKTQWLYTGYQWHEVISDPSMCDVVKYVDVMCDGPYIESLRDVDLHWVGSKNQNVIDVKERLQQVAKLQAEITSDSLNEVKS